MRSAASTRRRSSTGLTYAVAMLFFSLAGFVALYALQRLQGVLPFNPQALRAVGETSLSTPRSASSPTPTGSPTCRETTMSYLVADGGADGA